jgi:glyoxylase-like metal-dependent hydrolase (beta-lactamase superfamily II)
MPNSVRQDAMAEDIRILSLPLPLRMGRVNCYLIRGEAAEILVDTGGSNAREELFRLLSGAGCTPKSLRLVLLTHGDFDHIGNAARLRATFGAKLAMHPDDVGMAERGDMFVNRKKPNVIIRTLLPWFTGFRRSERFTPDILLHDGFDLSSYGLRGRVVELPGHSRGSVGVLTSCGALFCGDLLESTKRPGLNSLMDDRAAASRSLARLRTLEVGKVYPGHGRPFSMEALGSEA